ncbi:MAG: hypothetical protein SNI45_05890 [Rikenellaceae bacterium]
MKTNYFLIMLAALMMSLTYVSCEESDSEIDDPQTENTDPDVEDPDVEDPDVEDPDVDDPNNDDPDVEDPDVDDPNNDDPDVEETTPLTIEAVGEPTYSDFNLNITNDGKLELFYVDALTYDTFYNICEGDQTTAAEYALSDRFGTAADIEDYSTYANMSGFPIFDGESVTYTASDYISVSPSTTYIVLAYGISTTGEVNSEISTIEVTTAEMDLYYTIDFTIEAVEDFSSENFKVTVTPDNNEVNYIVGAFYADSFVKGSDIGYLYDVYGAPDYVTAATEWAATLGDWYGVSDTSDEDSEVISADFAVADGITVFNGTATVDMSITHSSTIKPETTYVVIAFAVDSSGIIISNVSHQEVTTGAVAQTGLTFTLEETSGPTYSSAGYSGEIKITPSNDTDSYYATVIWNSIDGLSDQEIYSNNYLGMQAPFGTTTGTSTYSYSGLSTSLYLVVFGYSSGDMTTEMTKYLIEIR